MNTREALKRIARLERLMCPQESEDGTIGVTIEQLCRESWNRDKKGFRKMAEGTMYQVFVNQFQAAEDHEACLVLKDQPHRIKVVGLEFGHISRYIG
jgi:ABC-type xylose transport system substrate-binding protein